MSYCVISDRIYISQLKYISVLLSEVYFILKRKCNNYMSYANDNKENCKKNYFWITCIEPHLLNYSFQTKKRSIKP